MKTAFPALIKSISVKSLVSGDKEGEIRLRFLPTDELLDGLNRLHRADAEVMIAIVPIDNTEKNDAIQKRTSSKRRQAEGGEV